MRSFSLLSLVCLAFTLLPAARADVSPVKIRVETKNDVDRGAKGDSSQSRTLSVYVTNSAKEPLDLKVKYRVFARNLGDHEVVSVGEGEVGVTVKPGATEKVDAPSAHATSNDGRGTGGGKNAKKAEPTGSKIMGHGVQVMQGDKLVAEMYEPQNLKEQFTKIAAPAPAK